MNRRQKDEYDDRTALQRAGWSVEKTDSLKFNSGSETIHHQGVKLATCHVLHEQDYRIDTEVTHPEFGEIDVLAYAGDGQPFAVECETNLTDDVKSDKLDRYVYSNDVIRDCLFLEVSDAPDGLDALVEWVSGELF